MSPFPTQEGIESVEAIEGSRGTSHVGGIGRAGAKRVDKGPMLGTPVAKCIAKEFKKAKVPAFKGDVVQVGKSFRFE